jgi:hypothetical protein
VLVHVKAVVPIDRKASKFGRHPEKLSAKRQPILLGWRQPPAAPLFRLKEHPWISCAARPLFEQLHRASKRTMVEATPPYSHDQPAFYPLTF